jgi:hypothetical protein
MLLELLRRTDAELQGPLCCRMRHGLLDLQISIIDQDKITYVIFQKRGAESPTDAADVGL